MRLRLFLVLIGIVRAAQPGWAADRPVAVSPGDASTRALVESRCPSFSWGAIQGAKSYELVVYRLGGEGEAARSVLSQKISGSALSWTPSLNRCLERGGRYAWSVRAIGALDESEWSQPNLFEVASGPSEAEFEAAFQMVQLYLSEQTAESAPTSLPRAQSAYSSPATPKVSGAPAPLAAVSGDSALQVNGSPVVTVATLAGALCSTTELRFLDQGDGTVLDCSTGLVWLKDASCADLAQTDSAGRGTWATAQLATAALASGTCGLTDGSGAGEWRQPTISEFCSAWSGSSLSPCPAQAAPYSLLDSSVPGVPKLVNAKGDAKWSADDAFVGLETPDVYWSSTESVGNNAWWSDLFSGSVNQDDKNIPLFIWPVRSGQ